MLQIWNECSTCMLLIRVTSPAPQNSHKSLSKTCELEVSFSSWNQEVPSYSNSPDITNFSRRRMCSLSLWMRIYFLFKKINLPQVMGTLPFISNLSNNMLIFHLSIYLYPRYKLTWVSF